MGGRWGGGWRGGQQVIWGVDEREVGKGLGGWQAVGDCVSSRWVGGVDGQQVGKRMRGANVDCTANVLQRTYRWRLTRVVWMRFGDGVVEDLVSCYNSRGSVTRPHGSHTFLNPAQAIGCKIIDPAV